MSPELDERFAWEVLLGRDRTVNAFALPGGYLGLHLGLIGVVGTRDELASVMAHELSHVTQRHISRLLTQQSRQTPLLLGAMVLGALAASKNPGATQALVVGGQALALQNQLNFSRDMEREADRVGMGLMEPAGFAPEGFVGMFDKLQQANRINDNGSWPYLRSHPLTTQRIADMQSRLPSGGLTASSPLFCRPSMPWSPRGRGCCPDPVWMCCASGWRSRKALALLRCRQRGRRACCAAALAPASCAMRQGRGAGRGSCSNWSRTMLRPPGWQTAEGGAGTGSRRCPLRWRPCHRGFTPARDDAAAHAQILLRTGQSKEVTGPLQTWLATHPRDASAWQAMAAVWNAQGQPLRAVRAEAEVHAARYDYAAAVDRFKAGQDLARRSTRPMTTSRRRSSTPGCAPCNHCFVNRPPSADSITRPRAE